MKIPIQVKLGVIIIIMINIYILDQILYLIFLQIV